MAALPEEWCSSGPACCRRGCRGVLALPRCAPPTTPTVHCSPKRSSRPWPASWTRPTRGSPPACAKAWPRPSTCCGWGVPPTLARTLRSTNAIQSMIGVCRQRPANVKRWRDGDMAMRWCAAGMVEAGKQFRRVNGHLHLASLRAALEREAAESVGATCHDDLVFMWSDRRRARRSPVRVADLIAAFGARRTGLRLAAAAISVTAAGRDGSRGQRRCQDQEHSAPRARVPGRWRHQARGRSRVIITLECCPCAG